MSSDESSALARIAIVSGTKDACFDRIRRFLDRGSFVQIVGEFETLDQLFESEVLPNPAMAGDANDHSSADGVIVFQSTSDQFAIGDIHRLVGTMLFGRVLCCYGPWCVSDGRSHDLWPVALRVDAHSAIPIIASELEAFRRDLIPISPMAASEEVLAYRMETLEEHRRSPGKSLIDRTLPSSHRDALVISPDRVFRTTLESLLNSTAFRASGTNDIQMAITQLATQRFAGVVLVDLDAFSEAELASFRDQKRSRTMQAVGVTGFPIQPRDLLKFSMVLEKAELYWQFSML